MVVELIAESPVVGTSRLSYVECHAALARAGREGRLSGRHETTAARRLDARWGSLAVVELDEQVARAAARLARDHQLRAADAVQLASAQTLANGGELRFACWDRRLWKAARELGFRTFPGSLSSARSRT